MFSIICVGDNVVDINYDRKKIYPGGNCVNVAIYSRILGFKSAYIGVLANDKYADILIKALDFYSIDRNECIIKNGETGRCACHLINGDRVIVDENDLGLVKSDPLIITSKINEKILKYDLIHTSCYSFIDDQLKLLSKIQIPIIYDFSVEWNKKRIESICPVINYALFSAKNKKEFEDNRELFKNVVLKYGCTLSIVTMGIDGSWVFNGEKEYFKIPYNLTGSVYDTTGCGDSWVTGFITTYQSGVNILYDILKVNTPNPIMNDIDINNYIDTLINESMCKGNMLSAYIAQLEGAFGYSEELSNYF